LDLSAALSGRHVCGRRRVSTAPASGRDGSAVRLRPGRLRRSATVAPGGAGFPFRRAPSGAAAPRDLNRSAAAHLHQSSVATRTASPWVPAGADQVPRPAAATSSAPRWHPPTAPTRRASARSEHPTSAAATRGDRSSAAPTGSAPAGAGAPSAASGPASATAGVPSPASGPASAAASASSAAAGSASATASATPTATGAPSAAAGPAACSETSAGLPDRQRA